MASPSLCKFAWWWAETLGEKQRASNPPQENAHSLVHEDKSCTKLSENHFVIPEVKAIVLLVFLVCFWPLHGSRTWRQHSSTGVFGCSSLASSSPRVITCTKSSSELMWNTSVDLRRSGIAARLPILDYNLIWDQRRVPNEARVSGT